MSSTTPRLRVALAQVSSGSDPDANLTVIDAQARAAAADGADLVVFGEAMMCRFGGRLSDVAEPLDGRWASAVDAIAQSAGITVVVGMFTPADDGRVRNTLLITGPQIRAHYDKIHLFDAFGYAESDAVAPGDDLRLVDIAGVPVGFATCYDIRFPELFTELAARGAQLIVVCASWGRGPGKAEQWSLLARARALDATSFVVACDQADPEASGETVTGTAPLGVGHSVVCSPAGEPIAGLGAEPGLLVVDLDLGEVDGLRRALPVLANRRPDVTAACAVANS